MTILKKVEILSNSGKLKGTKIYVSQDLNKQEQEVQKILRKQLRLAREKGYKAYIRGSFLVLNGDKYSAEQLQTKPEFNIHTKSNSAPATPSQRERTDSRDNLEADADSYLAPGDSESRWKQLDRQEETRKTPTGTQVANELFRRTEELGHTQRMLRSGSVDGKKNASVTDTSVHRADSFDSKKVPVGNATSKGNASSRKIKGG